MTASGYGDGEERALRCMLMRGGTSKGAYFAVAVSSRLILAPDWRTVTWTEAERARGQAWGLKTIASFHTHGTPPVEGRPTPPDAEPFEEGYPRDGS